VRGYRTKRCVCFCVWRDKTWGICWRADRRGVLLFQCGEGDGSSVTAQYSSDFSSILAFMIFFLLPALSSLS